MLFQKLSCTVCNKCMLEHGPRICTLWTVIAYNFRNGFSRLDEWIRYFIRVDFIFPVVRCVGWYKELSKIQACFQSNYQLLGSESKQEPSAEAKTRQKQYLQTSEAFTSVSSQPLLLSLILILQGRNAICWIRDLIQSKSNFSFTQFPADICLNLDHVPCCWGKANT
jgi:hypothetical protein